MTLTLNPVDRLRRLMWPNWRHDRAGRRAWRQAASWPELCHLMADFVESLEPEPHDEQLARANRAGYLIYTAGPGGVDQTGEEGRAAVFGFVLNMDLYDVLARIAEARGLILLTRSVRDHDEAPGEAIVRTDGVDSKWIGESKSVATLYDEWPHLSPVGRDLLYAARQVTLVDPVWGRNDLLWQALGEAVDLHEAAA